jgi:hypothetical protein
VLRSNTRIERVGTMVGFDDIAARAGTLAALTL